MFLPASLLQVSTAACLRKKCWIQVLAWVGQSRRFGGVAVLLFRQACVCVAQPPHGFFCPFAWKTRPRGVMDLCIFDRSKDPHGLKRDMGFFCKVPR